MVVVYDLVCLYCNRFFSLGAVKEWALSLQHIYPVSLDVGLTLRYQVHKLYALTFVTYAEADVGVALVRWEEEVQEVGSADKELGNLGALVTTN